MWRPVDAIGEWLRHTFGVQAQLRMGVLMVLGSLPLIIYGAWTDEPFFVYQMSAAALLFASVGVVVTAETLQVASDVDEAMQDIETHHRRCPACGQPVNRPEAAPETTEARTAS